MGFDNEKNVLENYRLKGVTSHNTYADILFEFGLLTVIIIMLVCINNLKQVGKYIVKLFVPNGYPMLLILIYALSLSLLKYELTYIFTALFISSFKTENNEIHKLSCIEIQTLQIQK